MAGASRPGLTVCFCYGSSAVSKFSEAQPGVWNAMFSNLKVLRCAELQLGEIMPNEVEEGVETPELWKFPLICSCYWKVKPCLSLFTTNSTLLLLFFFICGRLEEFVTKSWLQNSAINMSLYFYQNYSSPPQSFRNTVYYFRQSVSHYLNVLPYFRWAKLLPHQSHPHRQITHRQISAISLAEFKSKHGKNHVLCY